ncbi:hypothetical protein CGMCC3_g17376 [Colletotrichum fructicola]|nr:uncharacterized protein CGMCC3_g17376 [Colletotrichum fructicola]KAE9566476.1 hypothetical protein CGMCC3_g17376 [Colletotrichum fructicola]
MFQCLLRGSQRAITRNLVSRPLAQLPRPVTTSSNAFHILTRHQPFSSRPSNASPSHNPPNTKEPTLQITRKTYAVHRVNTTANRGQVGIPRRRPFRLDIAGRLDDMFRDLQDREFRKFLLGFILVNVIIWKLTPVPFHPRRKPDEEDEESGTPDEKSDAKGY